MNKGHRVDSSRNKVEADDVCAQDLSNAQDVNALVAGSLRVQQPYGDKERGEKGSGMVDKVGANNGPMRSSEWKLETKEKPTRNGKSGVKGKGQNN